MDAIHADVPGLASTTSGWAEMAPTEPGLHPICASATDPMGIALSAAVADWPATHEALTAKRALTATEFAAANNGTTAIVTTADSTNAVEITGIEG